MFFGERGEEELASVVKSRVAVLVVCCLVRVCLRSDVGVCRFYLCLWMCVLWSVGIRTRSWVDDTVRVGQCCSVKGDVCMLCVCCMFCM